MGSPPISTSDLLAHLKSDRRTQERRVRRMLLREEMTGRLSPHGSREIRALVEIDKTIHEAEADEQRMRNAAEAQSQIGASKPPSSLAEKVGELHEIDRLRLRDFADKFMALIRKQRVGDQNVAQDLEIKPSTEERETSEGDSFSSRVDEP